MAEKISKNQDAWLFAQTKIARRVVIVRSILRTLPVLGFSGPQSSNAGVVYHFDLAMFRAAALLWTAEAFPSSAEALEQPARQTITMLEVAFSDDLSPDREEACAITMQALRSLTNLAETHPSSRTRPLHGRGRAQVSIDALEIDRGENPQVVLMRPLWRESSSIEAEPFLKSLRARGPDWYVWAQWFLVVADGYGYKSEASARLYTDAPGDLWTSPEKVRRWIVERLEPSKAREVLGFDDIPSTDGIEPQEPRGLNFDIGDDGRIHLNSAAGIDQVLDNPEQREMHQELRSALKVLTDHATSNLAPTLRSTAARFADSLGASPSELKPALAVLRGNALRNEVETDKRRQDSIDPDQPSMPEGLFGVLNNVVQSWNIYVAADPFLEDIDANRLGPDSRERKEVRADLMTRAVDQVQAGEFATEDAIEALRAVAVFAQDRTAAADRAFAFQIEAMRNFSRVALRLALLLYRNRGKGTAAVVVTSAAIVWVHGHAELLRTLLADRPVMIWILEWVVSVTQHYLPLLT